MKYLSVFLLTIVFIGCNNLSSKPKGKIYINDDYYILLYNIDKNTVDTVIRKDGPDGLFYHDVYFDSICFSKIVGWPKTQKASWGFNLYLLHNDVTDTLLYETTVRLANLKFTPDGSKIAFLYTEYDKINNEYFKSSCAIYDLDKRQYHTILHRNISLSGISWAKDGQMLFLTSIDGKIIKVNIVGSVIDTICNGYSPTLSPDGEKLAFTDKRNIYILNLATGNKKKVVSKHSLYIPQEPQYIDLAWSPDSKFILYQGQYILAYITGWSSQYVVLPVEGWGLSHMVANITARGYGSAWVP
jgi:WD40 repeat protein